MKCNKSVECSNVHRGQVSSISVMCSFSRGHMLEGSQVVGNLNSHGLLEEGSQLLLMRGLATSGGGRGDIPADILN